MTTLDLREIGKRYGDVRAVRELTLHVPEGELLALLGPSGCGKTSTCKMIAGLEEVTEGDLLFGDERVNELASERRNVAMVFEDYALYPRMNVFQNVAFPLRVRGVDRREIRASVDDMLAKLELTPVRGARVQELSGGQQQRVSIARALVRQPALLILDEPLSHLDADLKSRLRAEIRWLQQERGVTAVLVSHDQAEAMAMADRIAVMHHGELRQCATPLEVYQEPADMFVAGFIGEPPTNFLPGRLVQDDRGELRFAGEGLEFELPAHTARRLALHAAATAATDVVLGVRPEHGTLVDASHPHAAPADVFFAEWFGTHQVVMVSRPGRGDHWLTVIAGPDDEVEAGRPVHVAIDAERLSFFDPDTQRNLVAEAAA